ncbi:hypothetical protein EVAR_15662_1 [Eumeta japonica]|uniref:Uncharacterized protein n=1 Tax=Eumeta variegata TaxID=151549 RepID=A0A4C1U9K9_EUMVA|nr:hypothetical protein EVAR_15662_1 [Eumeta japonica]
MASVLVNGFRGPKSCERLIVDEALMSHFGAIVMATWLADAKENLTSEGTVIVRTTAKLKLHDSILHAAVAITRHTDDDENAVGRFIKSALAASD